MSLETCQFCERWNRDKRPQPRKSAYDGKIKYGVRHYAHFECYVERRGLAGLQAWQVGALPMSLLREHNLVESARSIIDQADQWTKRAISDRAALKE